MGLRSAITSSVLLVGSVGPRGASSLGGAAFNSTFSWAFVIGVGDWSGGGAIFVIDTNGSFFGRVDDGMDGISASSAGGLIDGGGSMIVGSWLKKMDEARLLVEVEMELISSQSESLGVNGEGVELGSDVALSASFSGYAALSNSSISSNVLEVSSTEGEGFAFWSLSSISALSVLETCSKQSSIS